MGRRNLNLPGIDADALMNGIDTKESLQKEASNLEQLLKDTKESHWQVTETLRIGQRQRL